MTGKQIQRLMRQHKQTIATLAKSMQVTQARVREVRAQGVKCSECAFGWSEAIKRNPNFIF